MALGTSDCGYDLVTLADRIFLGSWRIPSFRHVSTVYAQHVPCRFSPNPSDVGRVHLRFVAGRAALAQQQAGSHSA